VVAVTSAPPPKLPASIAAFSVNPSSIQPGEQATLQWDTRDAVSVSISPDPGSVAPKGQISVRPSATTTFTLIATGSNEQPVTQHQTVTVTAPTVPTAPTVASPDDKALLQDVLRNFQSALDAHDIGKIQAIWAGKQSRDFQTFFKNNPEATVKDDCPASSLVLAGETAQWTCTETITIKSGGRIQPPSSHTIRFSFAKKNGTWSIADRR
jgi:hypothetical protein